MSLEPQREFCVTSPDEGHQPPGSGRVLLVRVTEVIDKHALFGVNPVRVHEQQYQCSHRGDQPVDSKSASHPYENRSEVSGVANESVRAAVDDTLRLPCSE